MSEKPRIPTGWAILPAGQILRRRSERARRSEQLLSVTRNRGVVLQSEVGRRDSSSDDKSTYWRVHIGDLVYNTMRMWQGVSGKSAHSGIVSPAYTVCEPTDKADPGFLAHLLKWDDSIAKFYRRSQGLVSDTWNLQYSAFKNIELVLPPLAEQRRIVEILDTLDNFEIQSERIVKKLKSIRGELLREEFEAIQNSQDIPVSELHEVSAIDSGVTLGPDLVGPLRVPYLRVANVQDGHIDTSELKYIKVSHVEARSLALETGDVLLTEGGDFDKLGRGAVWDGRIELCIFQNHLFRVRVDPSVLIPEYLTAYVGSEYGRRYFLSIAKQTTNLATINSTQLRAMPLPIPSLERQQELLEVLRISYGRIEAEQSMLARLKQLRTGLTDDLLSGRVRVAEAERIVEDL